MNGLAASDLFGDEFAHEVGRQPVQRHDRRIDPRKHDVLFVLCHTGENALGRTLR